jgi:hypothetical protein
MTEQTDPILTIGDFSLPISQYPEEIVRLYSLHIKWKEELEEKKLDVFKQEAAIRGIESEIMFRVEQLKESVSSNG